MLICIHLFFIFIFTNQAKKPIKAFAEELQKSDRLRGLQHSMLLSKTIDFLLEHAKVGGIDPAAGEHAADDNSVTETGKMEADPENQSPETPSPDSTEEESSKEDE